METLSWIGLSQALFGALLLLAKRKNNMSQRILAAWLVVTSITFFEIAISKDGSFIFAPVNMMITNVLLYLYSLSLTQERFKLKPTHAYHVLLPFVFILIIVWTGARLSIENYFFKDTFFIYRIVLVCCLAFSSVFYWYLSTRAIHKFRIKLKNEYSSIRSDLTLSWLLFVLIFYIVYNVVLFAAGVIEIFSPIETNFILYIVLAQLFLVYAFTFYGLRQQVFMPFSEENTEINAYQDSTMTDTEKQRVVQKLLNYFETKEPFLDRDLNLESLSTHLKIPKYKLTEVLNTEINKNFYRFVNEHRIEKAKKMLLDPNFDNISIEAVGYDCGFKAKSTFYTVFKNFTGYTPLQYKTQFYKK